MTTDNKKQQQSTILKIKGKLMYPKFSRPDPSFNNPRWTTDLLLDKEGLKIAKEHDLRIKKTRVNKQTGDAETPYGGMFDGYDGSYLRIEKSTHKANGEAVDPPTVKDAKLRDIPSNIQIGNGSEANVRFLVRNSDPEAIKKYGGYGMYLLGAQILDLVEYEYSTDPEVDFIEEDSGFEIAEGTTGDFDWDKGDSPFDDESSDDPDILAAG